MAWELLLSDNRVVTWSGRDGPDACRRYVASHPGAVVVAWRWPRHGLYVGLLSIVESGA